LSDSFALILRYLDPIIHKDLLGLRASALKTFSSLINHCKNTKIVDEEIKKTRKGLQNVTMDYIKALVVIYTQQ